MIKKILFFCLINCFHVYTIFDENIWQTTANIKIENLDNLHAQYLQIWSKLDLMKAININNQQKKELSTHILDDIIYIYLITNYYINKKSNKKNYIEIKSMIEELNKAFLENYQNLNDPIVVTILHLFDKLNINLNINN